MTEPALFLFDIDGTLISGNTVHREAFAHAFQTVYGLPLSLDGIAAGGRTDTWLLHEPLRRQGMTQTAIEENRAAAFEAMQAYVEERLPDIRDLVLPGVPETLALLQARGQVLGLLTGNLSRIAMVKMRQAGLAHFFDTGAFGEESEVRADLVPVALRKVAEGLKYPIPPERAVLVGDTPLDIEAGQVAGVRTAAVATGRFSAGALREAGADLVLPSLAGAARAADALMALALS